MLSNEKWNQLYNLYVDSHFMNYKKLSAFVKTEFNIEMNDQFIREFMIQRYPHISKTKTENRKRLKEAEKIRRKENEPKYLEKNSNSLTIDDKRKIIELIAEGKKQVEVAALIGISQAQVSRVINQSSLKIQDIKKAKILKKLGDIDINILKSWFDEIGSIHGVFNKCISKGLNITRWDIKVALIDTFKLKKYCKICNKEIKSLDKRKYCSVECEKEGRRDRGRTQQHNRRIQSGGTITQTITKAKKVTEANGICYLCGEKLDIAVEDWYHPLYIVLDHIDALVYSHNGSEGNLKPVCRCCNNKKSDKPADYYSQQEYRNNKRLRLGNYIPKKGNKKLVDKKQFAKDCKSGMLFEELCKKYNRSNYIVCKLKKELGLSREQKVPAKLDAEHTTKEVARLTKEGKDIPSIMNILNVSKPTVCNYRKKAKIEGLL